MYVSVSVRTDAKKESFERASESRFNIRVKEPAKQNLANARVRALVAAHFKLPITRVRILNGHHSPAKLLSVDTD